MYFVYPDVADRIMDQISDKLDLWEVALYAFMRDEK